MIVVRRTTIAALALLFALAFVATPVAGQSVDDNQTTGNESDGSTEIADQLGDLVINNYSYADGEMQISATWRGEAPTTTTLTEMIELDSGGSTSISFQRVRLLPDETTEITVAARERSGGTAAVLVSTPESVRNESALVLQSGSPSDRGPVPFNAALALIMLASAGGGGAVFGYLRKRRDSDDDDWHRRIG